MARMVAVERVYTGSRTPDTPLRLGHDAYDAKANSNASLRHKLCSASRGGHFCRVCQGCAFGQEYVKRGLLV